MNNEQKIKIRQRIIFGVMVVIILLICFLIIKFFDSGPKMMAKKHNTTLEKTFDTAANRIDFQEIWRTEIEAKEKELQQQINNLTAIVTSQQQERNSKIEEMQDLLKMLSFDKNKAPSVEVTENIHPRKEQLKIAKLTLNLTKQEEIATLPSIDSTIPAGSFAEAVLLSGVDATAAVSAGANPRPMLLRLTDLTALPRKFRTDLVDCHCTASAWGELSSERIHARIVKLSCVERDTGEILEVAANGYIAGADGKEGIRGIVASKEGQFLARSLWGGVFAGIGSVLSPANRAQSGAFLSIGGPEKVKTQDLFKSGFAESANNSLTKLSDYYIQRAEQIQPIIQVAAGQKVDVIFTEGVAIDKTLIRKKIAEQNDIERKEQLEQ